MSPVEQDPIDRFDAALDALARGEAARRDAADPDLVVSVRRLRALDAAQQPPPGLADRIWDEIANQAGLKDAPALPPAGLQHEPALNGSAAPRPWRARVTTLPVLGHRRWSLTQLAAAAMLLLFLAGSLLILRFAGGGRPETLLVATGEPRFETLLDTTVEGAPDEWTPLTVERWTFQPGAGTLTIPPLNGPQWIVADGGELVVGVDGAERFLEANAGAFIPAGQELVIRNPGDEAISALRGVAATSFALEEFDRAAITRQTALDTRGHEALPPGSSRVVFERLTIPAGTSLLVEPATGQDWVGLASGQLGLTLMGDAVPQGWSSGREREVAADELLPALVPGTRVSLHNIGEEPLVLLRLRVLPVDGAAGAAAP